MKTKIVWMLFAACMLGACSSDDEQQVEISQLEGRWLEVYEPGVVSEGIVYYTFHATSPTTGTCLVEVSDVFSGDHQIKQIYHLTNGGKRITLLDGDGFCATGAPVYEIVRLTESRMVWKIDDRFLYFERK
jgi:hypothetical protein